MAKKKRKLDPNRFKQPNEKGLLSFDPIRRNAFMWGLIAGVVGGFFMLRPETIWQVAGVFAVVFIANYHITKAARHIPRWHAAVMSLTGAMIGMFGIIILGTILIATLQLNGPGGG